MASETIWEMLKSIYEPHELQLFAITPQPDILGGKTPFQVLANEDLDGIESLRSWLHGCLYQVAT